MTGASWNPLLDIIGYFLSAGGLFFWLWYLFLRGNRVFQRSNRVQSREQVLSEIAGQLRGRESAAPDRAAVGEWVRDKVLLVTGAAGSIGSGLVRQLSGYPYRQLLLLDQSEPGLYELDAELKDTVREMITIVADITDGERLKQVFDHYQPEIVLHAAAYKHVPMMEMHPYEALRVNLLGTRQLAEVSCDCRVRQFIYISTDKAVNPVSVMGATKRMSERYIQSLSARTTRFAITRFGNVLGSSGSVVPLFTRQIAAGGPVTLTHPDTSRYLMTIPEACQLVLEAGCMEEKGAVYMLDMGKPVKMLALARWLIRQAGKIPGEEIAIRLIGLRPGEKLTEELCYASERPERTPHARIVRLVAQHVDREAEMLIAIARLEKAMATGDAGYIVSEIQQVLPAYRPMAPDGCQSGNCHSRSSHSGNL